MVIRCLWLLALLLLWSRAAVAATMTLSYPSSAAAAAGGSPAAGGDGNGYQTTEGEVYNSNNARAIDTDSGTAASSTCADANADRHNWAGWITTSIPAAAAIDAVRVLQEVRVASASGTSRTCVRASWNGGTSWSNYAGPTDLTTSDANYTFTITGHTWTREELDSPNFVVQTVNLSGGTLVDFQLDFLRAQVDFSPSGRLGFTGFEHFNAENLVVTNPGGVTYVTGDGMTGRGSLRIAPDGVSSKTSVCSPAGDDANFTNRANGAFSYSIPCATPAACTALPETTRIAHINEGSTADAGCFVQQRCSEGSCVLEVWYEGLLTDPETYVFFGKVGIPTNTLVHLELREFLEWDGAPDTVQCELLLEGNPVVGSLQEIPTAGACTSATCDINNFCLGTDEDETTTYTGHYDDMVWCNLTDCRSTSHMICTGDAEVDPDCCTGVGTGTCSDTVIGPTRVVGLYPNGIATQDAGCGTSGSASSCASDIQWECIDNYLDGMANDGATTTMTLSTGDRHCNYTLTGVNPDFTLGEFVESVTTQTWCNSANGNRTISHVLRSGATNYCELSGVSYGCDTTGTHLLASSGYVFLRAAPWKVDPAGGAWTEADLEGLSMGIYGTTDGTGSLDCTAMTVMADISKPPSPPDQPLVDYSGDGVLSLMAIGDSLLACTSCAYCKGGTCNGQNIPCQSTAQCNGCGGKCDVTDLLVNRLAGDMPEFDTVWNCAIGGMGASDMEARITSAITTPTDTAWFAGLFNVTSCGLVRGRSGHCSHDMTIECGRYGKNPNNAACVQSLRPYPCCTGSGTGTCNTLSTPNGGDTYCDSLSTGATCIIHGADYVIYEGGANDMFRLVGSNCETAAGGSEGIAVWLSPTHEQAVCPLARSTPTPGAGPTPKPYDVGCPRQTCTVDGDCASISANSKCQGAFNEHADPVWPCVTGQQAFDCPNGDGCYIYQGFLCDPVDDLPFCGVVAGCSGSDCCDVTPRYCTCPCDAINCTVDTDCASASNPWLHGLCVGGVCTECGIQPFGGEYVAPNASTADLAVALQRRYSTQAGRRVDDMMTHGANMLITTQQTLGRRFLWLNYSELGFLPEIPTERITSLHIGWQDMLQRTRRAAHVIDLGLASRIRCPVIDAPGLGGACRSDLIGHWNLTATAIYSEWVQGWLQHAYPVCNANQAIACGGCTVMCQQDSECGTNGDCDITGACVCTTASTAGTSPCGNGDGICQRGSGSGTSCAAGDCYCVVQDIADCPVGNGTASRRLGRMQQVCINTGAGSCLQEQSGARCTGDPMTTCVRDSDCAGGASLYNICAFEGVWNECRSSIECPGNNSGEAVCAGGRCRYPTPTS